MSNKEKKNKQGNSLTMKLVTTFALTYYSLFLILIVLAMLSVPFPLQQTTFNQYFTANNYTQILLLIILFVIDLMLILSIVLILKGKKIGKTFCIVFTLLIIAYQLFSTGFDSWLGCILELLLMCILIGLRLKGFTEKIKKGFEDIAEKT